MSQTPLRVGFVGATPDSGWARYAHIPAIQALPEVSLSAVATTRRESAERAASAFGAAHAFTSVADLAACADVDLVAVSVKAPQHFGAVMTAIDGGKHVFVEWPMGANAEQSRAMTEAASKAGVRGFVGLQDRASPTVRHARKLVADGYLGRVYGATMWSAYPHWATRCFAAYAADVASGADVLAIPGGHGLDVIRCVLNDEVTRLAGWETRLRPTVLALDVQREVPKTAADQFAASGQLGSGALFSVHVVGAAVHGERWRLQLVGDEGELVLEGDGMPEMTPLRLFGTRNRDAFPTPIEVAEGPPAGLPEPAGNMAGLWAMIAADLRDGTATAPDFECGLRLRATLAAIAGSAAAENAPRAVG